MNVFAVVFVYFFAQHKQRSMTLSVILLFMGVQTQSSEIRISLGGSALFAKMKAIMPFELQGKTKLKNLCDKFYK